MQVLPTSLDEVKIVIPNLFRDQRGFFSETYSQAAFVAAGIDAGFVQDNHSRSEQPGVLRGLHFQTHPRAQGKLVRVTAGEVFDVAVDLRSSSPTLGQWFGVTLSAENHKMLWVPPGFAHGFYVTSDYADFMYKCTDIYHPASEKTLAWDDPTVGISWPVPDGEAPLLSAKDAQGLSWADTPRF